MATGNPSSEVALPAVRSYAVEPMETTDDTVTIGVQFNAGHTRHRYRAGHAQISGYRAEFVFARTADGDVEPAPLAARLVHTAGIKPSELNRFAWTRWLTVAEAHARISVGFTVERQSQLRAAHDKASRALGIAPRARPGRKGHPPEFYGNIAERYIALLDEGHRDPVNRIANEAHVARATAAGWVREARARKHLPPARKGRAG
jgi:hypothetical protein